MGQRCPLRFLHLVSLSSRFLISFAVPFISILKSCTFRPHFFPLLHFLVYSSSHCPPPGTIFFTSSTSRYNLLHIVHFPAESSSHFALPGRIFFTFCAPGRIFFPLWHSRQEFLHHLEFPAKSSSPFAIPGRIFFTFCTSQHNPLHILTCPAPSL